MYAPEGTVDHYISYASDPSLTYEWDNYRYAWQSINSSKRRLDASVLDPFEVQAGWFEIILPSLQLVITAAVPPEYRAKAEFTLKRLRLQDGETVIRCRQQWYEMYSSNEIDIHGLRRVAPLIAEAVNKAAGGKLF